MNPLRDNKNTSISTERSKFVILYISGIRSQGHGGTKHFMIKKIKSTDYCMGQYTNVFEKDNYTLTRDENVMN